MRIEPTAAILDIGESRQLTARVIDSSGDEASGVDVRWQSSDPEIANVDQTGRVIGISEGQVLIEASVGGVTGAAAIEVLPLCRIEDAPETLSMLVGDTTRFVAQFVCPSHQGSGVKWASTDVNVAVVDSNGRVTSIAAGKTSLVGRAEADLSVSATVDMDVLDSSSAVSVLTHPAVADVAPGQPLDLVAEVSGAAEDRVSWRSLDSDVVHVDQNGRVTALRRGTGYIVAIARADTTSRDVSIIRVSRDLAVVPGSIEIPHGGEARLSAYPTGVRWSSDNSFIASVDSAGLVSALFPGTVEITAQSTTDTGVASTATVMVVGAEGPVAIERVTHSGTALPVDPSATTGIIDVGLRLSAEESDKPAAVELLLSGTVIWRADYVGGPASFLVTTDTYWAPSGLYTLLARITDTSGAVIANTPEARLAIFHRNPPPAIAKITVAGTDSAVDIANVAGAIDIYVSLDAPVDGAAAAVRLMLDGKIAGEKAYTGGPSQVVFTIDTTSLQNGIHDLWPLVVDAAGNVYGPPGPLLQITVSN